MTAAGNGSILHAELGQREEHDEQLHQQRGAADDRDVEAGDVGQHDVRRQPRQRHASAITRPMTKLMIVSGMVLVDRGLGQRPEVIRDELPAVALLRRLARSRGAGCVA